MKYNFDSIIDRKNTNSLKWDLFDDEYPMWVADMDFYAAPLIYESVNRKAKHGVYAYSFVNDDVFDSYIKPPYSTAFLPFVSSWINASWRVEDNL